MKQRKSFRQVGNKGFSLIELSMVLLIAGIILASVTAIANQFFVKKKIDDTDSSLQTVQAALAEYLATNGHYPCPAPVNTTRNDPLDGAADDCTTTSAAAGVMRVPGRDPDGAGPLPPTNVRIGAVPYKELNIPVDATLDGYGQRLSYAITEELAKPPPAVFDKDMGGIDVLGESGTSMVTPPASAHFFLYSHGEDGQGGYTDDGTAYATACTGSGIGQENCDGDAVFRDQGKAAGVDSYDDRAIYTTSESYDGLWARSASDIDDIYNINTGNVGIGVPNPSVMLDVNGDIQGDNIAGDTVSATTRMSSDTYCDESDANCMLPEVIGGSPGMQCPGGEFMEGISNNAPNCAPPPAAPAADYGCPAGEMLVSVRDGVPVCEPKPSSNPTCPAGQTLVSDGDEFVCAAISLPSCDEGEALIADADGGYVCQKPLGDDCSPASPSTHPTHWMGAGYSPCVPPSTNKRSLQTTTTSCLHPASGLCIFQCVDDTWEYISGSCYEDLH